MKTTTHRRFNVASASAFSFKSQSGFGGLKTLLTQTSQTPHLRFLPRPSLSNISKISKGAAEKACWFRRSSWWLVLLLVSVLGVCRPSAAWAQFGFGGSFGGGIAPGVGGGGVGGFPGGVGGGVGGGIGNIGGGNFPAGIAIDANGVVQVLKKRASRALSQKRLQALAQKHLPSDLNTPSPLRKVSLVRLEEACRQYAEQKVVAPLDIQFLAGLQRIDYVFVDLENKDLVIAGPAEGFAPDAFGRMVGVTSGRPPIRIDDLIVALRSVQKGEIGCSIDPVPARLAALKRYLARHSSATSVGAIRRRFQEMARILGMQKVRIWGVPPDSHFAQVLVEADYRMKRISIGLERPRVRGLVSHLALLRPGGNTLQRWWFVPLYDAIYQTDDHLAFQIVGQRAQLLAEQELITPSGRRVPAPNQRKSTQVFAKRFTEKFPELADKDPVFADLQNVIDLAVLAALFRDEGLPEKVGWSMDLFLNPEKAVVAKGRVPKAVPTTFNTKRSGRVIIGLLAGGVVIPTQQVARKIPRKIDPGKRLNGVARSAFSAQHPQQHTWWWD